MRTGTRKVPTVLNRSRSNTEYRERGTLTLEENLLPNTDKSVLDRVLYVTHGGFANR